jgi:GT2 family glycosyltransferase
MTGYGRADLSIVIVNYRCWDRLSSCLASLDPLLRGSAPANEIVVVDNVSGDGLLPAFAAAHSGVRFIENDGNWGFADGCNRGARASSGEFLLFLNPDAQDPGGGIEALLEAARAHPEAAIVTSRQVDEHGRAQKVFDTFPSLWTLFGPARAALRMVAPGRYPDPRRALEEYLEVDWVSGSALLIRRSVFDALDGFCNGFWMYSEDVDLCRRARDRGYIVAFAGGVTLVHQHGGATRNDPATAALTRSEVVVSRHFYASRHLHRLEASAYHVMLAASRFLPAAVAALASVLGLGGVRPIRIRAGMARHLARYYLSVASQGWRSRRSRPA